MRTTFHFFGLSLLIALLPLGLFALGLGGGFILDDMHTIVHNDMVHLHVLDGDSLVYAASSFYAGSGSRPLSMLSFALDFYHHGSLDAATFKITNLIIHALTTLMLALLLRRLLTLAQWPPLRAAGTALIVALLWALHPLQVSSVLYVVQRMQTLVTLFTLCAMWAYLGLRSAQIAGKPGWPYGLLAALFWLLALASKEDGAMLPAYLLALELTVLQFHAHDPARTRALRNTFIGLTAIGLAVYLLVVVPHYWSVGNYTTRDFSSTERLLTQARVLVMYLGQSLFPLPSLLPFNYDNYTISPSLFTPATTLPSIALLLGLLALAWRYRKQRPVFALGIFLFFAGHFITSNVVPLELVFEHRNHLPLMGVLLTSADLLLLAWQHWQLRRSMGVAAVSATIIALALATAVRAHAWGEPLRFAQYSVQIAPYSSRAWAALGNYYFRQSKHQPNDPSLDLAIATAEAGARKTHSLTLLSNVIIYKTIDGSVQTSDWEALLQQIKTAPMTGQNRATLWTLVNNLRGGQNLDQHQALRVISAFSKRTVFLPHEDLDIGAVIYTKTKHQADALPYFIRAARQLPANDSKIVNLRHELTHQGQQDWVKAIEAVQHEGAGASKP